jgi:hypothetical protein
MPIYAQVPPGAITLPLESDVKHGVLEKLSTAMAHGNLHTSNHFLSQLVWAHCSRALQREILILSSELVSYLFLITLHEA